MRWDVLGGLMAAFPLLADVSSDRDKLTYLLAHVEENGRVWTRIYALHVPTRRIGWTFDTADTFEVRPARLGRSIFIPSGKKGIIHCVDAMTGRERWKAVVEPFRCMIPLEEDTFITCGRNTRVACWVRRGEATIRRWEKDLPVQAREVWRVGDRLYVPTYRSVLCMTADQGKVIWEFIPEQGECLYVRPSGREIFVWDWWRHDIFALDAETGKVAWRRSGPASPCLVGQSGSLLLLTYSGGRSLHAVDAASGKEAWSMERLDLQRSLPPTDDLTYHPFVRPVLALGAAYAVIEENKVARCLLERGNLADRWDVGEPIVGLAALPDAILVAVSNRWILYRRNGERLGEIRLPSSECYLRAIE